MRDAAAVLVNTPVHHGAGWITWDPLILAAVAGTIAVVLYLYGKAPRVTGFLAAATVLFVAVGVPRVLALAHRPLSSGLALLIVIAGTAGAVMAFWLIVVRGHHKRPLFKRKSSKGATGALATTAGRSAGSGKAPHHRAMAATVGAMVFAFLFVLNLSGVIQVGRGGITQTYSQIAHI